MKRGWIFVAAAVLGIGGLPEQQSLGQVVVPGTGTRIDWVGDDFEDPNWGFVHRLPKSSREDDGQSRSPMGYSLNRRWFEGPERGQPDQLQVVQTPPDGLPGSEYSLLMRTLRSGIPGRATNGVMQDDLIVDCVSRIGSSIPVSELPSCVVRVCLPSPEHWENRSGPHFGFRAGVSSSSEPYWPGLWIHFRSETSPKTEADSAFIKVRGDSRGRDFKVMEIDQFGWWTLGMSFTADGSVHYFARPGVEPLTAADHLTSQYPYSFRAVRFRTFFFNVCNKDDGYSWSTPFVIDDPELYVVHANRVNTLVARKIQQAEQRAAAQQQAQQRAQQRAAARQQGQQGRSR